jgi:hypothetical protein
MEANQLMGALFDSPMGQFWVGLGAIALGLSIIAFDVFIWRNDRAAAKRQRLERRDLN